MLMKCAGGRNDRISIVKTRCVNFIGEKQQKCVSMPLVNREADKHLQCNHRKRMQSNIAFLPGKESLKRKPQLAQHREKKRTLTSHATSSCYHCPPPPTSALPPPPTSASTCCRFFSPMPCLSMRAIRSASVSSGGGVVSPEGIASSATNCCPTLSDTAGGGGGVSGGAYA